LDTAEPQFGYSKAESTPVSTKNVEQRDVDHTRRHCHDTPWWKEASEELRVKMMRPNDVEVRMMSKSKVRIPEDVNRAQHRYNIGTTSAQHRHNITSQHETRMGDKSSTAHGSRVGCAQSDEGRA